MIKFLLWVFGRADKNNIERNIQEYEKNGKRIL